MSEIHAAIATLEKKLLGTWTRKPALRAAWTPNPLDFFTVRGQLVARACAVVAGAGLSGDDLGTAVVAQLGQAGDLSRSWKLGEAVVSHDDLPDPIQALDRWRELRSLQALLSSVAKAVTGAGPTTNLAALRGDLHEALAASEAQSAVKAYSDSELMELAYEAATTKHSEGFSTGFPDIDEITVTVQAPASIAI